MSRETYDVKESYTGDGSLDTYTFDFKIEANTQLEVVELDADDVETQRVRGDDSVYLSSVTFDAVNGAGTVVLAANLTSGYTLILLLANDDPTQPYEFSNKTDFTLTRIMAAFDWVAGAIQRLAYRGKQALRIHDSEDEETFDAQLPPDVAGNAGAYLQVNDDGDGFAYGVTLAELQESVFPTATLVNEVPYWTGAAWASGLRGGGLVVSATQSIANGGDITLNTAIQQILKVQGDAGAQIASVSPFASNPSDGGMITLLGMSASNTLTIQYSDIASGCLLNGDCELGLGDTLTLVWDLDTERYYEISRNR